MAIMSVVFILLGASTLATNGTAAMAASIVGGSSFWIYVVSILATASYIAVGILGFKARRNLRKKGLYISIALSIIATLILTSVRSLNGTTVGIVIAMGVLMMILTRRHVKKSIKELQNMSAQN